MSLAHMLLNNTSVMEAEEKIEIDEEIEKSADEIKAHVSDDATTEAWTDFATESLVNDIYNIDKAYHTADIIAEVKVLREGADPAVLLEGIVKSGVTKIKEAFKKFWVKIKAWFAEVKRQFMIMSKSGKDFIKQFKAEIEKKYSDTKGKNFSYVGREYAIDAGIAAGESIFNAVQKSVEAFVGYVREGDKAMAAADKKEAYAKILKDGKIDMQGHAIDATTSDIQDKFISSGSFSGVKGSDISDLKENLIEVYHKGNGADYTETIDGFAGCTPKEMMDFVDKYEDAVKKMAKNEADFDKMMNGIIKAFEAVEKKDVDNSDTSYDTARFVARALQALLPVGKVHSDVYQAMYKEAAAQYERVLKSFLRWKPAKESVEVETGSEGLLEQAMAMLF